MKTFEENWTAWIDGQLTGKELVEFESLLSDKAAAEAEKQQAHKLGALLKRELSADILTNEDFFSHQLRERIARESSEPDTDDTEDAPSTWWTIRRLFWTGATSMALFLILTVFVMKDKNPAEQSLTQTQLLSMRLDQAAGPDATITMFEDKEERVTVLWTEGLKSLPSDYAAK